ncbi:MAG: hypothetical protein R2873_32410 [Caldilineaceae bacterium]
MWKRVGRVMLTTLANMLVMIMLHGNSRQWWPKIPFLSLRNESIAEHSRLLFNMQAVVTVGEAALGKFSLARRRPRLLMLLALPALLPLLILFGRHVLRLEEKKLEIYYLSMVPTLPLAAAIVEEVLVARKEDAGMTRL